MWQLKQLLIANMTMTRSDPTMTKTTFNCHSLVAIEKKVVTEKIILGGK